MVYNKYEKKKLENSAVQIPDVGDTELKIKPDFYIHNALLKAQDALNAENLRDSVLKYRTFIEHIEVLCKAGNLLPENYDQLVEDYIKNTPKDETKPMKIANYKLGLMMNEVFSKQIDTSPLTLDTIEGETSNDD